MSANHETIVPSSRNSTESGFSFEDIETTDRHLAFVFSSFDQGGLQRLSKSYSGFLGARNLSCEGLYQDVFASQGTLENLAYTLSSRRTTFNNRSFAIAHSLEDLQKQLQNGLPQIGRVVKNTNSVWIFTGQGAQWPTMGKELLRHSKVYRESMTRTQSYLSSLGCTWDIFDELLTPSASRLNTPELSQPVCTAIQVALVDLLRHCGLQPTAVVGHSSGEIGEFSRGVSHIKRTRADLA